MITQHRAAFSPTCRCPLSRFASISCIDNSRACCGRAVEIDFRRFDDECFWPHDMIERPFQTLHISRPISHSFNTLCASIDFTSIYTSLRTLASSAHFRTPPVAGRLAFISRWAHYRVCRCALFQHFSRQLLYTAVYQLSSLPPQFHTTAYRLRWW